MLKYSLFIIAALSSSQANAFHVPEHVKITERAVAGLKACGLLPRDWDQGWTEAVVKADENEDYDLYRKWSRYSHYYNPNHTVKQLRADSSLSVKESVEEIRANPQDTLNVNRLVGRIVHHVQDSSVPGHAIPVVHANADGFESYSVDKLYAEPLPIGECASLAAAEPLDVLRENALATLAALQGQIPFQRETFKRRGSWLGTFWQMGEGNEFGAYGPFGDHFGKPVFELEDGRTVRVDPRFYTEFKRAQVNAAVRATQAVILWANRVRGL